MRFCCDSEMRLTINTMSYPQNKQGFMAARRDFHKLRRRAVLRGWLDRMKRQPLTLCSFGSAGQPLLHSVRQLQEVCLDDIRGSVGRAQDYTANFLPRHSFSEERWARVRIAIDSDSGVPPLELFKLDGVLYVKDGHHRVSVFKYLNVRCVEAYVTTFRTTPPAQKSLEASPPRFILQGSCQACTISV